MFNEFDVTKAMQGIFGWFKGQTDVGQSLRDIQKASSKKLANLEQAMKSHESKILESYNELNESLKDFGNLTPSDLGIKLGNISKFLESLPEINELPENHVLRSIKKGLLKKKETIEYQLDLHNRSTETLSSIQGWVNSNTLELKDLRFLQGKVELKLRELQRDGAVLQITQGQIEQIETHLNDLTKFIKSEEEIQSVSVQLAALNLRELGKIQHSELDALVQKLNEIFSSTQLQTHQVEVEKLKEQINTTQQNLSLELSKQIEEKTNFFNKLIEAPTNKPAQSFTSSTEIQTRLLLLEKVYERFQSSTILSEEHIALKEQVNKLIPLYLEELRNVVTLLKNAEAVHAQVNQLSKQPLSELTTVSLESNIQKLQTWKTQLQEQVEFLGNNSNAGLALQTVILSVEERLNDINEEIQTRYELGNSLKELIKAPTNKPAQSFKTSSEIEKYIENLENQLRGLVESSTVYEEHVALKQKATMEVVPQYLEKLQKVSTQLKNVELIQSKLDEVNKKTVLKQITGSPKVNIEELQAWQTQLEEELQSLNNNFNAFLVVQNVLKEVKQRLSKIENALEFFKSLDLPLGDKTLAKEIQAAEESLQKIKINFKRQETGSPYRLANVTHKVLPLTYNQETGVITITYDYVPDPGQGIHSESQTATFNLKTGGLSLPYANQFTSGRTNYLKSNGNGAMTFDDYKNSVENLLGYISSKLSNERVELVSWDVLREVQETITRLYLLKQAERLFC